MSLLWSWMNLGLWEEQKIIRYADSGYLDWRQRFQYQKNLSRYKYHTCEEIVKIVKHEKRRYSEISVDKCVSQENVMVD